MKRDKYNATCKGKRSKTELTYSKWLQERGKKFEEQKKFILQDAFEFQGEKIKAITFTPDFYLNDAGVYVDFKGMIDHVYPLKKKLFLRLYNLPLVEVVSIGRVFLQESFKNECEVSLNCPYCTLKLKKWIDKNKIKKDTKNLSEILKGKIKYNYNLECYDLR